MPCLERVRTRSVCAPWQKPRDDNREAALLLAKPEHYIAELQPLHAMLSMLNNCSEDRPTDDPKSEQRT